MSGASKPNSDVTPLVGMGVRSDMMTSVCDVGFSALPQLREMFHHCLIILRANRAVGVKRMTIKRMRVSSARPACYESSPIANSHHENSNLALP